MTHDDAGQLVAIAKHIQDLDELIAQLLKGLPRVKPWHRQIARHLADVDRQLQVLRMTVSMEKQGAEILQAAQELASACRLSAVALMGTRADATTRAAVNLVADLAERIRRAIAEMEGQGRC
ncbi:hypothetical protein [Roseateles puraquae]|uniref:hypothetical protein n=1 Tax=Roseateles puraquae TaxID=431059 RepID=UPI0031DF6AB4